MGFFYTSITLKGPTQEQIATHLRAAEREAYVSPTLGDITVVFDRACEDVDPEVINAVCADLSNAFGCLALFAHLHDDDVLMYALYIGGTCVDEYDSDPAYFEDREPEPPSGGDARMLCTAFGKESAISEVETLLRQWDGGDEADEVDETALLAEERHQAVAKALGLPVYAYSMGYYAIEIGNIPQGADPARLVKITP